MRIDSTADAIEKREPLLLLFLAAWIFLIYSNTFHSPFIFDDIAHIPQNPHIRISNLSLSSLLDAGFNSPDPSRPVANISLALNYYLDRYNPTGYHVVNILIHIAATLLLYFISKNLLFYFSGHLREQAVAISMAASFLWAVHPLHTQSVTYIIQRMNSLAAMFYLLSFLLYIKARSAVTRNSRIFLYSGCLVSSFLALGSKEIAATLPFFIFLFEWFFVKKLDASWLRQNMMVIVILIGVLLLIGLLYLGQNPMERILIAYERRDFTIDQRLLTQFRIVVFYITLLLFPHPSRLNLDHHIEISTSLMSPITTFFAFLLIIGSVLFAIVTARKNTLISFCILWFFGNLLIESSVIALELIFEHRTYLPSTMAALLFVIGVNATVRRQRLRNTAFAVIFILFSLWTYQRNMVWQSRVILWEDVVTKSPQKARPYNNLGDALAEEGRFSDAAKACSRALEISPEYQDAINNLGVALIHLGDMDAAMVLFEDLLEKNPRNVRALTNMGIAFSRKGELERAISFYDRALAIKPEDAKAHNNMGVAMIRIGHIGKAVTHFKKALRINPFDADARDNYKKSIELKADIDRALERLSDEIAKAPANPKNISGEMFELIKKEKLNFDAVVEQYRKSISDQAGYAASQMDIRNYGKASQILKEYERRISACSFC